MLFTQSDVANTMKNVKIIILFLNDKAIMQKPCLYLFFYNFKDDRFQKVFFPLG